MHPTFNLDFLNIMLSFFIKQGDHLLAHSARYRGMNNELKTKIKEAIETKKSKEWFGGEG